MIVGGAIGVLITQVYSLAKASAYRAWIRVGVTLRSRNPEKGVLAKAIVEFYSRLGWSDSLYEAKYFSLPTRVAVLASSGSQRATLSINEDAFFNCNHLYTKFAHSPWAIMKYRLEGARIFDGEFMWVRGVSYDKGHIRSVEVGRFNFFAYATLCRRLHRELMSRWNRRKGLHKAHLANFAQSLSSQLRPQAVGNLPVMLLRRGDGFYVPIAKRSAQVVNGPGIRSLLPVYGMECTTIGGAVSAYGLSFYNFVREFCEELFDLEDLVDKMKTKRIDPDWIFQIPAAARVLDEFRSGRAVMIRTGLCVNPNDGILNQALMVVFESEEFFEWLRHSSVLNWESELSSDPAKPSFEFVRLDDERLDRWAVDCALDPSAVFALDLAREWVASSRPPESN